MTRGQHSRITLRGIVLILALIASWLPASAAPAASQVDPASEPIATTTLVLPAGELVWRAGTPDTLAAEGAPVELHPGFVYAHNEPLLLLFDDGTALQRVPLDEGVVIPEAVQAQPVAATTEAPVPYLSIELLHANEVDDSSIEPFAVREGAYELSLWRVDFNNDVPADMTERLSSYTQPILAYVLVGEAYLNTLGSDEQPRHLDTGDWSEVMTDQTVITGPDAAPPVLLFAMLEPAEGTIIEPEPSAPSGGANSQPVPNAPAPTEVPVEGTAPAPTEVPVEPTAPALEPTVASDTAEPPADSTANHCSVVDGMYVCLPLLDLPSDDTSSSTDIEIYDDVELRCEIIPGDADGDGIGDACEKRTGTDPNNPDSDGDELRDGDEVNTHKTDPTMYDTDQDGLGDGNEVNTYRTNPLKFDTDGDGLNDGFDLAGGTDPLDSDFDDDGLPDGEETVYGSYPKVADSDGDGLTDGEEVITYGTSPTLVDTDYDTLDDPDELAIGTSPLQCDTDGDGDGDALEWEYGGSPLDPTDTARDDWDESGGLLDSCG